MLTSRKLNRRSFVALVAGAPLTAGLLAGAARAQGQHTGLTDQDPGDRPQQGTLTGITDQDPADPENRGRRLLRITDYDRGATADAPGPHRRSRPRGCTDRDAGEHADPIHAGRGSGVTDQDRGRQADPARCGRGGR